MILIGSPCNLYLYKYENVCLLLFFLAISKPIGKPFGMKLVFDSEKVLKQSNFKK